MKIYKFSFLSIFLIISILFVLLFDSCTNEDGCTNETALNYDPAADQDDGSCIYTLAVPTIYEFERGDSTTVVFEGGVGNSVFYEAASVRHLLVSDLDIVIEGLGKTGASSIEVSDLLAYYETGGLTQLISTPTTGFSPLQSTFDEIDESTSLAGGINNSFGAADSIVAWLNRIAVNSQDASRLGTPLVYTEVDGRDLKELIHTTLLGAVIYNNLVGQIDATIDASSSSLVSGTNYTTKEHAWDLVMGYFGAARNYGLCSDAELGNVDFAGKEIADENESVDGLLDWTSEYSFYFSRTAAERDLSVSDRDFTAQLFSLLLQGRTSITNKNRVETDLFFEVVADSLELVVEELVSANLMHFLNATLQEMTKLGSVNEDIEALNREWASMLGFVQMLQYRNVSGDTPLTDEDLEMILNAVGGSPNYATEGTAEQLAYIEDLEEVKDLLQTVYGFSDIEVEEW